MNISLTDTQISDLLNNEVPVMPYSELIKKGVMNVLRSSPSKAVVFLVRQQPTYGHWCLCFLKDKGRSEQGIHVYDSYGNKPDSKAWKKNLSRKTLKQLHQENPYLLSQLYDTGKPIYFNEYQHQAYNPNVATCGRHVVCRASFLDLDTDEYNDLITSKGMSPDQVVVKATNDYL
jgi:hypothetical protein